MIKDFFLKVYEWHKNSFNYNLDLKETHPYASKWWGWYLLFRPIWLYFKDNAGQYIGVVGLGNPLSWWTSLIIVPLLIWGVYKKNKTNMIILAAFLIFWVFWAPFGRVLFYYHAMPSALFLILGIAFWLVELKKDKIGKILVLLYFILLFGLFIFFLPIWIGIPITSTQFYHRTWLKGWI